MDYDCQSTNNIVRLAIKSCNARALHEQNGAITAFEDINTVEFLAELQGGSTSAFDILVDRLLPYLVKFVAFGKNVPEADAEELASDVLMTVHDKIGTFRHSGAAKLTTWIFQIAKNRALDYYRRPSVVKVELAASADHAYADDKDVHYAGRNREQLRWLVQQLSELPEQDQWLLKWRAEDIPYSEIAEWLGIAEGTARVRHNRALQKLRTTSAELARKGATRT